MPARVRLLPRANHQRSTACSRNYQRSSTWARTLLLLGSLALSSVLAAWALVTLHSVHDKVTVTQEGTQTARHEASKTAQQRPLLQTAPIGPPPKVALLFLSSGSISNEAVWRAFFSAAAQLQLAPDVAAAAAAAAAQHTSKASVADAVGPSTPLHPDVGTYPQLFYPGFRVQHGLTPGADAPSTQLKRVSAHAGQQASAASSFPAAAHDWEQQLLQQVLPDLTAKLPQDSPVKDAGAAAATAAATEPLWYGYRQLSTMRQALAAAAAAAQGISHSSADNSTGRILAEQQPQQWHTDHNHCLASVRSTADTPAHDLFSVYVHTPAGVLLPQDSLLSGCELPVRLNTSRGYAQHVLAEAGALLLAAALSDPLNTKFVLVSDSSIPLYPPQVVWAQLMHEPLSRLDACHTPGRERGLYRWRPQMATLQFGRQHWRKSSQWFVLSRPHSLLAVADVHVREMLHRYCYSNLTRNYPTCVSDEHWLPSLLASYGLENQTDCEGNAHFTDWSLGGWHPRSFTAADLTPELVTFMRAGVPLNLLQQAGAKQQTVGSRGPDSSPQSGGDKEPWAARLPAPTLVAATAACDSVQAVASANRLFAAPAAASQPASGAAVQQHQLLSTAGVDVPAGSSTGQWLVAAGYSPLAQRCPLFARKFGAGVQQEVLAMALSCRGLGLGPWCVAVPGTG